MSAVFQLTKGRQPSGQESGLSEREVGVPQAHASGHTATARRDRANPLPHSDLDSVKHGILLLKRGGGAGGQAAHGNTAISHDRPAGRVSLLCSSPDPSSALTPTMCRYWCGAGGLGTRAGLVPAIREPTVMQETGKQKAGQ